MKSLDKFLEASRQAQQAQNATLWAKAKSLGRAAIQGACTPSVKQARLDTCSTCPRHVVVDGHHYCNACGCPNWVGARLGIKLHMQGSTCPLGLWAE